MNFWRKRSGPIEPPEPRHVVENLSDGVRIIIPSRNYYLLIIIFAFSILYILFFTILVISSFTILLGVMYHSVALNSPGDFFGYFFINIVFFIFLVFIFFMGGNIIFSFLWQVWGREIIEVRVNSIMKVQCRVFRRSISREYFLKEVSDLRLVAAPRRLFYKPKNSYSLINILRKRYGNIAFDYGAKTFSFGADLEEAEAKQIIAVLNEYIFDEAVPS